MANINKIRLSGTTYNIQDLNAPKTVELTQAQYDALAVKDPNTFYIITDAQGADLSQYYTSAQTESAITQAVSGKVDTSTFNTYSGSVETALSGKQDTLVSGTNIKTINNESLLGSGNINIQGGGGKAVNAGTNISITTGETADTINCSLPIKQIVGYNSVIIGDSRNTVNGDCNVAVGCNNSITAKGGSYTPSHCFVGGERNNVYNTNETAFGHYNNSVQNTSVGGESGTTLFSVGNGTSKNARHNAFEIRQNGDIYITKNGQDVKLQDQLGGGGGSSYTAGDGIDITNDIISVTGMVDTTTFNTYSGSVDTALSGKQDTLSAGTGIEISGNVISATGGGGTVDPSLDSGSTNPVANSAITNALHETYFYNISEESDNKPQTKFSLLWKYIDTKQTTSLNPSFVIAGINGTKIASMGSNPDRTNFELVETSAITTSITSSSTDVQVPSAKAVYDIVGNIETLLSQI